jgi:hypothetical protein
MKFKSGIKKSKFDQAVETGLAVKSKELAGNFYKAMMEDEKFPVKTEALKKSIKVRSRKARMRNTYEITMEMLQYGESILDGVPFSEGIYREAKTAKAMIMRDWDGGNRPTSRGFWNGNYFFKRVRFHVKKNDFYTRALRKLERTRAWTDYSQFIELVMRSIEL